MIKMKNIVFDRISYVMSDQSNTPIIRSFFQINLDVDGENGWVWVNNDYYLSYGMDIGLTGFNDIHINLMTDKKLCSNLPYKYIYHFESPQLKKCLIKKGVKNG